MVLSRALLGLAALCFIFADIRPSFAQQQPSAQGAAQTDTSKRSEERGKLPPDAITRHELALPSRKLWFTAKVGHLPIVNDQGASQAEITYIAYSLEGGEAASRPVTFVLNGGPGAASAWLHLGALGPWRIDMNAAARSPSAPVRLTPNPSTWLDFTDLVFIDPVGTGYSRSLLAGDENARRFWSVDGDIASLSEVIAKWLAANGRSASPKYLAGESYGGFRLPLLTDKLRGEGVGIAGMTLVSPVLDFGWGAHVSSSPFNFVSRLPSLAAAQLERRQQTPTRDALAGAEDYAAGAYLNDLVRGVQDPSALTRMQEKLAALTGLDGDLIKRLAGRIDLRTVQREWERGERRVVSAYDTAVSAYDPEPFANVSRFPDPFLANAAGPLTSAVVELTTRMLNYPVERRYNLLSDEVNRQWRWGQGRRAPEAFSELRQSLALDPNLKVLITHGFTDLVTPYFESELLLRQLPDFGSAQRVRLQVYPGGHMFYSREESLRSLREDAAKVYEK